MGPSCMWVGPPVSQCCCFFLREASICSEELKTTEQCLICDAGWLTARSIFSLVKLKEPLQLFYFEGKMWRGIFSSDVKLVHAELLANNKAFCFQNTHLYQKTQTVCTHICTKRTNTQSQKAFVARTFRTLIPTEEMHSEHCYHFLKMSVQRINAQQRTRRMPWNVRGAQLCEKQLCPKKTSLENKRSPRNKSLKTNWKVSSNVFQSTSQILEDMLVGKAADCKICLGPTCNFCSLFIAVCVCVCVCVRSVCWTDRCWTWTFLNLSCLSHFVLRRKSFSCNEQHVSVTRAQHSYFVCFLSMKFSLSARINSCVGTKRTILAAVPFQPPATWQTFPLKNKWHNKGWEKLFHNSQRSIHIQVWLRKLDTFQKT